MANNNINMPSGFGGLVRYTEEYSSRINISPAQVIVFIVLIVAFRIALGVFL